MKFFLSLELEHSDRIALGEVVLGAISCLPGDNDVFQLRLLHELIDNLPLVSAGFAGVFWIVFDDSVPGHSLFDERLDSPLDASVLFDA